MYSSLDLTFGSWQVPLSQQAKEEMATVSREGLFQYENYVFGLYNATSTFQRLMDIVLGIPDGNVY